MIIEEIKKKTETNTNKVNIQSSMSFFSGSNKCIFSSDPLSTGSPQKGTLSYRLGQGGSISENKIFKLFAQIKEN